MLTWVKSEIFCCFMCFTCHKDDPKDAVGTGSTVVVRHHRKHHHKRRHYTRNEDDDDYDFDDDDSDEEIVGGVECDNRTKFLKKYLCYPLIQVIFGLTYWAPLVFIAGAILYHLKIGIYHLHRLSVKQ